MVLAVRCYCTVGMDWFPLLVRFVVGLRGWHHSSEVQGFVGAAEQHAAVEARPKVTSEFDCRTMEQSGYCEVVVVVFAEAFVFRMSLAVGSFPSSEVLEHRCCNSEIAFH